MENHGEKYIFQVFYFPYNVVQLTLSPDKAAGLN